MKGIKNSIKKLRNSLIFRDSTKIDDSNGNQTVDIENKRLIYQQSIEDIVLYKGYEFPGDAVHKRVLETIEDLSVREDDIFLISYPANGGHLLEDIVQSLVQKHLEKKNKDIQPEPTSPLSESSNETKSENENNQKTKVNVPVARLEASNLYGHIRWLKSIKSPRLISTSLPYDLLPQELQTPTAKLIYMGRNSKDHIVAYYYHHRLKGIQISLDDFVELYLNGRLLYGNYFDHVVSYWQLSQLYQNNVLFICYEELKIITLTIAKMIAQFLNLNLNEEEIEEIIVNKQGKTNAINCDDLKQAQQQPEDPNRRPSQKLNKFHNVLGDWDHYLDSKQVSRVDDMIRIKFDSQRLQLAEDVETALQNIKNYSRIMKPFDKRKSRLLNVIDKKSVMMTLEPRKKSTFRKKLVLTKDEAMFIRKKDKVVIIDNSGYQEDQTSKHWFWRLLSFIFCGCFGFEHKKTDYTKL